MAIAWKFRSVIVGRDSVNNPAGTFAVKRIALKSLAFPGILRATAGFQPLRGKTAATNRPAGTVPGAPRGMDVALSVHAPEKHLEVHLFLVILYFAYVSNWNATDRS